MTLGKQLTSQESLTAYELFAGVGGFRIALERSGITVNWSNQWEPGQVTQTASKIYVKHFGTRGHSNEDITTFLSSATGSPQLLPEADLLVGGFPCQDYSVAKSRSASHGIQGKKGVLWWEIFRILESKKPKYVILENVDRLLSSPSTQRGRDFAVMLESLLSLGYEIEWKVVNAGDYGFPQKRRRVFIVAWQSSGALIQGDFEAKSSLLHRAFPSELAGPIRSLYLPGDIFEVSETFNLGNANKPFENHGMCSKDGLMMARTAPIREPEIGLGSILVREGDVDPDFWLSDSELEKWAYLKGAKSIPRKDKSSGYEYFYSEGRMPFPDPLDSPGRTIVTGEGGKSPSRFKHVILQAGKLRRLMPIELERMNGFPDDWTETDCDGRQVTPTQRAFLMGNALVIGVVERISRELVKMVRDSR